MTRRAFTLVEAMLAATILSIVAATAVLPYVAGTQQVQQGARTESARALGAALMEEILARPFFAAGEPRAAAPGPEPDETTRRAFDNVDDFDGYSEKNKTINDFQGKIVSDNNASRFWRAASVQYVTFPGQEVADRDAFVKVQVTVYFGNDPIMTLSRLVSRED